MEQYFLKANFNHLDLISLQLVQVIIQDIPEVIIDLGYPEVPFL